MNRIMAITKLKLNDENLLEDWKVLSKKINEDLAVSLVILYVVKMG